MTEPVTHELDVLSAVPRYDSARVNLAADRCSGALKDRKCSAKLLGLEPLSALKLLFDVDGATGVLAPDVAWQPHPGSTVVVAPGSNVVGTVIEGRRSTAGPPREAPTGGATA